MRRALLLSLVLVACSDPAGTSRPARRVRVAFTLAPQAGAFQGPFVSVVDNVALTVTGSDGGTQQFAARLARRDSTASFGLTLPEGSARFDARVLSNNGQPLFGGSQTANITQDDFLVRVRTAPQAPVLLLAPDTLHVTVPLRGTGSGTIGIYNRGLDTLVVRFRGPAPQANNACNPLLCSTTPPTNTAGPFPTNLVTLRAATVVPVTIYFSVSNPFPTTIMLDSNQGSVPLVIVTP